MTIWKLGCNWGKGAPSFYEWLKENKIVITYKDYLFEENDLIGITEGYNVRAIAKVSERLKPVTSRPDFKNSFEKYKIEYSGDVYFASAEWYELNATERFQYELQKGIRRISKEEVLERINMIWGSRRPKYKINNNNNKVTKKPLNTILFGPPGTGKTYNSINKALEIIGGFFDEKSRKQTKSLFDQKVKEGQIVFTTFHQSMSYEDFIEGIKPQKPFPGDEFVKYDIQNGIFKELCEKAKSNLDNSKSENRKKLSFEDAFERLRDEWEMDQEIKFPLKTEGYDFTILGFTSTSIQFKKASGGTGHTLSINSLKEQYYGKDFNFNAGVGIYYPGILSKLKSYESDESLEVELKNYVLIIDEINRGNVSQIFGELITLIEEDKRLGKDEELTVTLPYSKEKFGVPQNLYIIGTMNTADRSVEALDAALRRRFNFEEMPPDPSLIVKSGNALLENIDLALVLATINKRIEKLLDKDHLIGHSYFMSATSLEDLKAAFQNKIIPLLQEYFFGDYGKIGLILGKGFFEELEEEKNDLFAPFGDYRADDFAERATYKFKKFNSVPNTDDEEFLTAINTLLKV